MKNTVIFHNFRVTFLGKDIVRVERARAGEFFDGNTFFIPDRASLVGEPPEFFSEGNALRFGGYELLFPAGRGLRGLRLTRGGRTVYRYKGLKNCGELPSPPSTPEVFAVADRPRILIPEGGYSAARKGDFRIYPDVEDVYLLLAGKDAAKLRRLYTALTGRCELVRLSTLGMWNSKYYAYTQKEAKELISDYERRNIPLDNMVIDTDWRLAENGIGYRVNKKLFPDMKGFLAYAHSRNVEVMFNDHPEPVRGANVFASREIAYREKHLKELLGIGLDTWWYDRNWQTHLISPTKDVAWETFGLYLYYDVTRRFYEETASGAPRRPVVMGNVVNVANGVYCGISDTASHRYSVQWTGDIDSGAYSLAQEVENLVRCGENCVAYMNSDCGGHTGNPEKEQYIRWMQYGAFSPVFRPHCTNTVLRTREPWLYDEETVDIVRRYIELRYHLMPYLYANAYHAYETGMPMFRSLALMYPHDRRAAARRDEYLLGDDILVAPVCGVVPLPLSEGEYTAPVEVTFYRGIACEGEPIARATWKTLSMNLRHEPPMEGVPTYYFSAKIRTKIKLNRALRLYIRNDDGATVRLDGKCVLEDKKTHSATLIALADLAGGIEHTLEIDYFQAEGEAFLGLYTAELSERDEREIYLPAGKWMDVFDGSVYTGKRTVKKRCDLASMPLFVRLGALIPLAETAHTLKEQSFSHIVYDFYPGKAATGGGFLYEDDGETTAYKDGAFSRSDYSAEYLPEENAYLLRFEGAEGEFEGARVCTRRKVTVKYHVLKGADVVCAYLDGTAVPVRRAKRAPVFPFGTGDASPDAATLIVEFETDPRVSHEVRFLLKSGD